MSFQNERKELTRQEEMARRTIFRIPNRGGDVEIPHQTATAQGIKVSRSLDSPDSYRFAAENWKSYLTSPPHVRPR